MKKLVLLAVMGTIAAADEAHAAKTASFDVSSGQTVTTAQTLGTGNTGTVESGGTLSVSGSTVGITLTGDSTVTNSGKITQTGTGRGIRDNTDGINVTINNNAGATIATADADAIQFNTAGSNVILNNYGTINSSNASAGGSQAVDFNAITTGTNIINNYASGVLSATEADAVRPGVNGVVNNAGTIISTNITGSTSSSDGVDAQTNTGITVNNSGLIEGARHGITGGNTDTTTSGAYTMSITNAAGGTIAGENGSGINIDGFNGNEVVNIVNNGTITGNGVTRDGDGIDVDGVVNIVNTGTIRSIQAYQSASEGITVGGGTIINSGTIEGDNINGGVGRGITLAGVNQDASGATIPTQAIYANSVVVNSGLIRGQSDSAIAADGAAGQYTVTIDNLKGGVIEGGGTTAAAIYTGANKATIVNYGTITADSSGLAVDLGSGNSSLSILGGGATVNGNINGGTGTSSLTINPGLGNSFTYADSILNFSQVSIGQGTVTLDGISNYAGTTTIATGGTLIVGDAMHDTATGGSGLTTVASGATLGGYGSVLGAVNNAGTIAVGNALPAFANSGVGTFTIAGDYTGSNGTILLNTYLGNASTAATSDKLVIGGNATGSTTLAVNVSGAANGRATVGDGVELVQVNGTASANSFRLSSTVQGGAYQYLLNQGGSTGADNFYLRSTLGGPNAAVAYRPAVPAYSMTPSLNLDYGYMIMGRRDERMGVMPTDNAQDHPNPNGFWGRLDGDSLNADSMGRFAADQRTFFAQLGKDWTLSSGAGNNNTHAGVMITLGNSSANFADNARGVSSLLSSNTGSLETHAQSLGGYLTRNFASGLYFDGVSQFTHYQNRYGDVYGDNANQNGFGVGVSGEVGQPFSIAGSAIAIEPQVQLLYQYLNLNGFNDAVSSVSGNASNALRGRAGFRIFHADLSNGDGSSHATPYFMADVIRDFVSPGQTTVGSTAFDDGLGRTQYDVGVGVSMKAGKFSSFYANVKYARNLGGEYRRDVSGLAGYRLSW